MYEINTVIFARGIKELLKQKVPYHNLEAEYYFNLNKNRIIKRKLCLLEKFEVNVMIQLN